MFAILGAAGGMLIKVGQFQQAQEMYERVMKSDNYYKALNIISEYVETELSVPDKESQTRKPQFLESIQKNKMKSKKQPERWEGKNHGKKTAIMDSCAGMVCRKRGGIYRLEGVRCLPL